MNQFKTAFVAVLFVVGFCTSASASVLVVSDIDDTLKNSHVLNTWDAFTSAGDSSRVFRGMPEMMRALAEQNSDLQFEYLSNAPASLMSSSHEEFLNSHGFPAGRLNLRPSLFQQDFKISFLRELLSRVAPSRVLLIGDNGEQDSAIYAQIQREFPAIRFSILVHRVYSPLSESERGQVLNSGQRPFLTSIDAILILVEQKWLPRGTPTVVTAMVQEFVEEVDQSSGETWNEAVMYFPVWGNCRDLKSVPDSQTLIGKKFWSSMQRRCRQ